MLFVRDFWPPYLNLKNAPSVKLTSSFRTEIKNPLRKQSAHLDPRIQRIRGGKPSLKTKTNILFSVSLLAIRIFSINQLTAIKSIIHLLFRKMYVCVINITLNNMALNWILYSNLILIMNLMDIFVCFIIILSFIYKFLFLVHLLL